MAQNTKKFETIMENRKKATFISATLILKM